MPISPIAKVFLKKVRVHHGALIVRRPKHPYGGYTLRSEIEAPLITREVLPETYFLLVIMAADAQARPFLQFQASC